MTATNPYSAPQVEVEARAPGTEPVQLASPGSRLGAVIVDGLVFVPGYVVLAIAGAFAENSNPTERDGTLVLVAVLALLLPFFATWYYVVTRAQTIGKRVAGIYVARLDGTRAGFWRILLLRNALLGVIQTVVSTVVFVAFFAAGTRDAALDPTVAIAVGGFQVLLPLIDMLMIFSADHRTLHDRLGGTIVARVR